MELIGNSGSQRRLGQVWRKDPGLELKYWIQNLKSFVSSNINSFKDGFETKLLKRTIFYI